MTALVGREHITVDPITHQLTTIPEGFRALCDQHKGWYVEASEEGIALDEAITTHIEESHCAECGNALERAGENIAEGCFSCAIAEIGAGQDAAANRAVDEIKAGDSPRPDWMGAR